MSMNAGQARVVDPILSNVALGFSSQGHVGLKLFPRVPVMTRGGQIIKFGDHAFRLYNARRAPGGSIKRVEFGYSSEPFGLAQESLEGKVPRELMQDAKQVPNLDLGKGAIVDVMEIMNLSLEVEQADLARDAAKYDANHKLDIAAAKWTDDANNPKSNIDTARQAVRDTAGVYPNVAVIGAKAFDAACNNAKVIERFKYTGRDAITEEMLARMWNLDAVHVGKAIVFENDGTTTDVWGNDMVLAYVPPEGTRSMRSPSYGYTYVLNGNPMVEPTYWDKSCNSWIYPVTYERRPVQTSMKSGFLLQNLA